MLPEGLEPMRRLREVAASVRHRGDAVVCPCCGGRFDGFEPYGERLAVLCPRCGAAERHRLLWLWLERSGTLACGGRWLHFAPEDVLARRLRDAAGIDYVTADLDATQGAVATDIQDLVFADDDFDVVLCSHVLEHVPDDIRATRELRRVTRPGGLAVVMVPQEHGRAETLEDPAVVSEDERLRVFGQRDHVRLYGDDVAGRLGDAGFAVEVVDLTRELDAATVERHGLMRRDRWGPDLVHACR